MRRIVLKSLGFAVLAPLPAAALLVRGDREDEEYAELATRYPPAISLGVGQGEGVLVAPDAVLTAAHRAEVLRGLAPRPRLRIGQTTCDIAAISIHPEWKAGAENDVALLRLARPVEGIAPARIHRASDEAGQGVVLVAHGLSGKLGVVGNTGPRRRRASINTIAEVRARSFVVTIKPGDDASDLQGAAVREETGAPAFIDGRDGFTVAGILAAIEEAPGDAPPGSAGEREIFVRISAYAGWIDAAIGQR